MFTTLNVQHLESLNDVVGGITGIQVWETVPDTFFDDADEVMLVDIPADDLLARLKAGKVYVPEQIERAARNFFRKGNLMALRELALRRTADRVEDDVQAYRTDKAIERGVEDRSIAALLRRAPPRQPTTSCAALPGSPTQLGVEWTAVYVETPALQRLPPAERERILRTVKLAQELGATNGHPVGRATPPRAIVDYARTHNCSKVIVGRQGATRRWPWGRGLARRIAELAPEIDLIEIGRAESPTAESRRSDAREQPGRGSAARRRSSCGSCGRSWPASRRRSWPWRCCPTSTSPTS